ncbi:MAG: DUF503 domain-containing protein [Armatimonadota bacterium]
MFIGVLRVLLEISGSTSLKDKRQVVKSILDSIRNKHNASCAEVGFLNNHNKAELGFACVSNDKVVVNNILNKIFEYIDSNPLCEIIEHEFELL